MTTPIRFAAIAFAAVSAAACTDKLGACNSDGSLAPGCSLPQPIVLQVTPPLATISIGQSLSMGQAIYDNPGFPSYSVSWSSADTTKAVVSANGIVKGIAPSPGVAICATASFAGDLIAHGCSTVVVQPDPPNFGPTTSVRPTRP